MSGISFMARDSSGHIPMPLKDTWVTKDGTPADLKNGDHYPVTADCKICLKKISLSQLMQMEWRHVPPAAGGTP